MHLTPIPTVPASITKISGSSSATGKTHKALEKKCDLKERKVVWKPALSTPFTYCWPEISDEVGQQFLIELLKLLAKDRDDLNNSERNQSDNLLLRQHSPQLEEHQDTNIYERCLTQQTPQSTHVVELRSGKNVAIPDYLPPRRSKFYGKSPRRAPDRIHSGTKQFSVVSGINSTTKALEAEIRQKRDSIDHSFSTSLLSTAHCDPSLLPTNPSCQPLSFIFVCRNDLNPISLVDHLLPTVANLNQSRLQCQFSVAKQHPVILIPLPKGAENKIAAALGLKRAAVVGLKGIDLRMCSLFQSAEKHVKPVLPPNAIGSSDSTNPMPSTIPTNESAGLANENVVLTNESVVPTNESVPLTNESVALLPTHIKHYKTTVPTDMRKHHLERSQRKKQRKTAKRKRNDEGIVTLTKKNNVH